jgi:DNA-binding SARP family transcriptional activator
MKNHTTEKIVREQDRRKFFGRFAHRIPFKISEHTANWLATERNRIKELREGGFKRIQFKETK